MAFEFTVPFYVAEDCAGIGTGYLALKRSARRMQRTMKTSVVKLKSKCKYISESNPRLRAFLQSKYKGSKPKTVIADDCAIGTEDGGDRHLGTDGELDLYMSGSQCQPFSKMGKNGGRADERADTMREAVSFITKRKPKSFICEQVPNIKKTAAQEVLGGNQKSIAVNKSGAKESLQTQEVVQAAHADTQHPGI